MDANKQAFFEENAALAMEEQIRYGIPASVTLIQMYWESGRGASELAQNANNYFGVKEHRKGVEVYHADDRDEKNAPFKVYDSKEASVRDHSLVLMGRTYNRCHGLSADDYKGWLKGLKASGYASAKGYDTMLVKDLEAYNLQKYDKQAMIMAQERGKQCGYMREQTLPGERVASLLKEGKAVIAHSRSGSVAYCMPLAADRLVMSDGFGVDPTSYRHHRHNGIDLRAAKGTELLATENNGKVVATGFQKSGGNFVTVEYDRADGSKWRVSYCHLDKIDVKKGDTVNARTHLGLSGSTGNSTGPHLHLTTKKLAAGSNEFKTVNPLKYLAEVTVRGNLDATVVKKNGQDDLLASHKKDADVTPKADEVLLAQQQQEHLEEKQQERDLANEETVARTAKSNLFSAILGEDGSGLGQMFQGGTDITSGIVQMLFMSFLALAFNKHDDEQQQEVAAVQPENATLKKEDYDVRESRETVQKMADQASTAFDLQWPESQGVGQQISQQNSNGYSVG